MRRIFAIPLLIGAGFLVGLGGVETAYAQPKGKGGAARPAPKAARPPVNRPAPRPAPNPAQNRPAPRPSVPTPSRPQPQARPQAPAARPNPPAQRPAIGQRPNLPNAPKAGGGNPTSRPVTPRPVNPTARPGGGAGTPAARPNPGMGLGGGGTPAARPGLPNVNRPGGNSNERPSVLPNRPDPPATRPGINLPSRPGAGGGGTQLPIGERPNLPNRPNRPDINWPTRPGQGGGGVQWPDGKFPKLPDGKGGKFPNIPDGKDGKGGKFPNRPDRPIINWPNRPGQGGGGTDWGLRPGDRPNVINRPGINQNGKNNVVVNRPTQNNVNVNNINRHNNYYNNNTVYRQNNNNWGGYNPWVGNAVGGWNSAWFGNYNAWNQGYHPWYNGSWTGALFNPWGVGAAGAGFGNWALNSQAYNFGYSSYVNPFYAPPAAGVPVPQYENYSQPVINVVQAAPDSGQPPPPMPETATQAFDAGRAAFLKGDYGTALEKTEAAMKAFSNDPVLHEFRALVLFAMGKYKPAAAAVHALLASGPGWDYTTLMSLYPDVQTYQNQLAALETAAAANPNDASLQFLLAYHAITAGQADLAKSSLAAAQKLLPNDPVVAQLAEAAGVEPPKAAVAAEPKAADIPLNITGAWTAARPDGGTISLTVQDDGAFTWGVQEKGGKKDAFDGTFTLESDLLVLERKAGGVLTGRVTPEAENKFNFKVLGGPTNDPGLTFVKS